MSINYLQFNEMPKNEVLDGIIKLHTDVFSESDDLIGRMKEKHKLQIDIAMDQKKVVGYKAPTD